MESTDYRWFPWKGPVLQSLDAFFDVSLNQLLDKQSSSLWLDTPWRSWEFTVNIQQFLGKNVLEVFFSTYSQHGWVNAPIIKCGMKLFIISQTPTAHPLEFENG